MQYVWAVAREHTAVSVADILRAVQLHSIAARRFDDDPRPDVQSRRPTREVWR